MLFSNLKNSYIVMDADQKAIFEAAFKGIINGESNEDYKKSLQEAVAAFDAQLDDTATKREDIPGEYEEYQKEEGNGRGI
ncbi:Uncharacterised protein [uncultured archaeon]|nr:Uncharacterised protein [uncultured archaeon]